MAFLSQRTRKNGKVWLVSFRLDDQRQRSIYLGDVSKTQADDAFIHINELIRARRLRTDPKPRTAEWVAKITGSVRDSLVRHGLVQSEDTLQIDPAQRTLKPFLQRCIDDMTDSQPGTRSNYGQTRDWLLKFFPDSQLVADITRADMSRWQRHLKAKLGAVSNRNKHIQRAKRFFKTAVESRLVIESPAGHLKFEGGKPDKSRQFFIDAAMTEKILKGLPDANWKILFVLMRYQGIRRVEAIELKWEDVDWSNSRLRINSRKTGYRECPIFPETLAYLKDALVVNGDQLRVVRWHSDEHSVTPLLIKHAKAIVGKAWPKICTNLRSTRRTELDDKFPGHVVSAWLGHSEKVALDHYQQVTVDHWERAANQVSAQVSIFVDQESISGAQTGTKTSTQRKKSRKNTQFAAVAGTTKHPREDSNL